MRNKYEIKITSRFKKDLKVVRKRKYFDADLLNEVVEKLANDVQLDPKYKNHSLINDNNADFAYSGTFDSSHS